MKNSEDDNMNNDDDDRKQVIQCRMNEWMNEYSFPAAPDALQQEAEQVDDVQVEVQRGEHILLRTDGVTLVT